MSSPPTPPGRVEVKYRLRPSLEIAGPRSIEVEFTVGPRLIGADQSEYLCAREVAVNAQTSTIAPPRVVMLCLDLFISKPPFLFGASTMLRPPLHARATR